MKFIATFGSSQLPTFDVNPMSVMLVLEGENDNDARKLLFKEPFNGRFATSYPYEKYAKEFKEKYNMKEYTLKELLGHQRV